MVTGQRETANRCECALSSEFARLLAIALCLLVLPAFCHPGAAYERILLPGTNTIQMIPFGPGEFMMGRPAATKVTVSAFDKEAAEPQHLVRLSRFWLSKYPINVEQFCEFLNSGGLREELTFNKALLSDFVRTPSGRFLPKPGRNRYPIRNVTLGGAVAFCEWLSQTSGRSCRLPTEAEWEFAAKGSQGRTYPWGETPQKKNPYGSALGDHPTLGTPDGVQDLNGPVYQYCADRFDKSFYASSPILDPLCTNGTTQVLRGGPMYKFMGRLQMPPVWKRFHANESELELCGFRIVVQEK